MKNSMRKILSLLLLAAMLFSLAACGKGGDAPSNKQEEEHPEFVYASEYKTLAKDVEYSLSPGVFTGEGFYATSYEKIGENIPEGVTPEYQGQYDIYGSFLYHVSFDGKIEKLEGYEPLPNLENTEGLKDFSSSGNISGMCLDTEGNLLIMEQGFASWSDAPEGMSRNDDEYWQYQQYKQYYTIRKLDSKGTELSRVELQCSEEEYLDAYRMQTDADGNVVFIMSGAVNEIRGYNAGDGSLVYSIPAADGQWFDSLVKLADGRLGVSIYGEKGQELHIIDTAASKLGESYIVKQADLYSAIPGSKGYDLYYNSGTNFYGLKLDEEEPTKLFSWLSCDVNSNEMARVFVRDDGSVVGLITGYEYTDNKSSYNYELVTVKEVPYDSVPHKETLTLACMYPQWQTTEMIVDFNRSNPTYRIEVVDYSEYNTEEDYEAGLTKLNTEIMAGNVPDILDVSSLNYTQLASKGIIEDLYPYIDNDNELDRGDFFENVLQAMEVDGKLCATVTGFYVNTVMGASSVVGDEPGWSYDEFMAALASMPEGCQPFDQYTTRETILQNCLALDMDSFVNWGSGQVSFDSQQFIDLLEFAKLFPETFDWENYDYSNEESTQERIAQGKQMLVQTSVYSIEDLFWNDYTEYFGGNVTFVGYPSVSGVGNMLNVDNSVYAMSSKTEHKDAVWQFLREFMTRDYQKDNVWSLASRKDIFDEMAKEATTIQYQQDQDGNFILDENGEQIPIVRYGKWDDKTKSTIEVYAIEPEQVEQVREIISSTTKKANYDSDIFKIVSEEAAAFFQGQKSAQDVAKLIQSKANIFVNEQR